MEYFHQAECSHFIWITLNDRLSAQFGEKNSYKRPSPNKRPGPSKRTVKTGRQFEQTEKDTDLEED